MEEVCIYLTNSAQYIRVCWSPALAHALRDMYRHEGVYYAQTRHDHAAAYAAERLAASPHQETQHGPQP